MFQLFFQYKIWELLTEQHIQHQHSHFFSFCQCSVNKPTHIFFLLNIISNIVVFILRTIVLQVAHLQTPSIKEVFLIR
jgi:hypothetical protein